jgi:hypothetical protein
MVDQDGEENLTSSDEWYWYDKSRLAFWLLHDTWPAELGLCLICDIDPEKSEELDFDDLVDMVNIKPEDKPPYSLYERICLLSEDPIYKLEREKHPAKRDAAKAKQYLKDWTEGRDKADIKPEYINPDYTDICNRIRLREAAYWKHDKCWLIFLSNPLHSHNSRLEPSFLIEWAASKRIDIPWLDWAKARGYLAEDSTESQLKSNEKLQSDTPSDKRRQEGLQAAIEILNQKHANGELNNWQDFELCMRKAEIIAFVRDNPTDYPNCSKTKTMLRKDKAQTIKDQEPTLTKSFSDFTKDPTIWAEYERLRNGE